MQRSAIVEDVEATLGVMPSFMDAVPPPALEGFWSNMKNFEMGETTIPMKYKQLIGLAVASQIPCTYCVAFHKEAAKLDGATEEEMREAIMMAALTRQGSTILNGMQQDLDEFRSELAQIVQHVKETQGAQEQTTTSRR